MIPCKCSTKLCMFCSTGLSFSKVKWLTLQAKQFNIQLKEFPNPLIIFSTFLRLCKIVSLYGDWSLTFSPVSTSHTWLNRNTQWMNQDNWAFSKANWLLSLCLGRHRFTSSGLVLFKGLSMVGILSFFSVDLHCIFPCTIERNAFFI